MAQQEEDELVVSQDGLTLFDCFGKVVYAYIRQHIHSREEAKDLLLDVFIAALNYENLRALSSNEQLIWLRRVAHNKIVDSYRHAHRHPVVMLDDVTEILFEDESRSPEQLALQQEMRDRLRSLVKQLPITQQQILQWRYGDELRFAEIAILLKKREETVRQMCSRTLVRLRKLF